MRNHSIGILGGTPSLDQEARTSLADFWQVHDIDAPTGGATAWHTDAILVPLSVVAERGIQFFAQARRANPRTHVLVLADEADQPIAMEVLHCGATETIRCPADPTTLVRKLQKVFRVKAQSPFDGAALVARPTTDYDGPNRRRCYRASIPVERPLLVMLESSDTAAMAAGEDLSISFGSWPGGLLLRANGEAMPQLPFATWRKGKSATLALRVTDGPIIDVDTGLVRETDSGPPGWQRLALRYETRSAADSARLARYWIELQIEPQIEPPSQR